MTSSCEDRQDPPSSTSSGEEETGAQPPGDEPTAPEEQGTGAQPPGDEPPAGALEEPAAEEPPEGVHIAQEPAGPCRMCSSPIDVGERYMVLNIGRRVHFGDCSDQARAAGYLGEIEADAGPA